MGIEDGYTAFCFNEACAYILAEMKDGKEPVFKNETKKVYKKPSDFYKKFE